MKTDKQIKFGTDGWRAIIAEEFTFENLGRLARRTAEILRPGAEVAVGYDNRFFSPEYASFFSAVLEKEGVRVDLSDRPVPTPCVSHRVKEKGCSLGACISASHNPPSYNGLKIKESYGGSASSGLVEELTASLTSTEYRGPGWELKFKGERNSWGEGYTEVMEKVLPSSELKVVCDYFHGSGYPYFERALRKKGYRSFSLREGRDPLFGGGAPEPRPSTLGGLEETLRKEKADIGFGFDGDADRIAVVDEKGRMLSMQAVLALLAWDLLEKGGKGRILRTVAGTVLAEKLGKRYGTRCVTVPIGFKNIVPEMLKGDLLVAGEESGGVGFGDYLPERDALYTASRILEMIARRGKLFGELWDSLTDDLGGSFYLRKDYPLSGSLEPRELLKKVSKNIKLGKLPFKLESTLEIDGIRMNMEGGRWVLVRPSGTEPLLRVYAETENEEETQLLLEAGKEMIE